MSSAANGSGNMRNDNQSLTSAVRGHLATLVRVIFRGRVGQKARLEWAPEKKMARRELERAISYHSFQELCGKGSRRDRLICGKEVGLGEVLLKVGGITANLYPDRNDSTQERGSLTLQERDGRITGVLSLNGGDSILIAKHSGGPAKRAWPAHPSQRREGRDDRHRSRADGGCGVGVGGSSPLITCLLLFS